jgi:hypothetical protein
VSYFPERGRRFVSAFEDIVRIQSIKLTLLAGFLFSFVCLAQQTNTPLPPLRGQAPVNTEPDETQQRLAREMAKKANLERQATLKSDTEKLVKLTAELKAYVDKSNENVLSLEVLKKADEIEKLAHNVKEKMKGPN